MRRQTNETLLISGRYFLDLVNLRFHCGDVHGRSPVGISSNIDDVDILVFTMYFWTLISQNIITCIMWTFRVENKANSIMRHRPKWLGTPFIAILYSTLEARLSCFLKVFLHKVFFAVESDVHPTSSHVYLGHVADPPSLQAQSIIYCVIWKKLVLRVNAHGSTGLYLSIFTQTILLWFLNFCLGSWILCPRVNTHRRAWV